MLCAASLTVGSAGCAGGRETRTDWPTGQNEPPSAPVPQPPSKQHVEPPYSTSMSTPVVLDVAGPEQPKPHEQITMIINVKRQWLVPFDLSITLPAGTKLLSGQLHEKIEDGQNREMTRQLVFMVNEIPTQDVQVRLSATGEGYGVSALKSYCFGRPCNAPPVSGQSATGTANESKQSSIDSNKEYKTLGGGLGRSVEIGGKPAKK